MSCAQTRKKQDLLVVDEETEKKVELAWRLILKQFFHHVKKVSTEEGPGMNIFKMLNEISPTGSNCSYFYAEQGSIPWNSILEFSGEKETIEKIYDPSKMVLICMQVPVGNGAQTTGNLKLFDVETQKEVCLDIVPPKDISKSVPPPCFDYSDEEDYNDDTFDDDVYATR